MQNSKYELRKIQQYLTGRFFDINRDISIVMANKDSPLKKEIKLQFLSEEIEKIKSQIGEKE